MKTARLEEEQLIERYILRQMTEEEASEFEAFYLSNQECLDQLELAQRLFQGLEMIAEAPDVAPEPKVVQISSHKSWWQRQVPAWSLAASLLLAILPSGYLYHTLSQQSFPDSHISVVNLPLSELRGAEQAITIKRDDKQVILSAYIDTDIINMDFPLYGFQLSKGDAEDPVWQLEDLQLTSDGMLYIDLGKNYLQAGRYQFNLFGLEDGERQVLLKSGLLDVSR
ncbi:hypothetical protein [Thalassomonas actiniarum]|uniref:Anti-sigma factor n=1 Tax=Thalassomonas actiniarum TaxID=485447 RepID=A0AAE9YRA9_9GAMM|nr:hypothetical protein [Thalassomonas actiniarum]WDD99645.1 hypothetical protein SG35_002935 [Thalassomonas actiniarum]